MAAGPRPLVHVVGSAHAVETFDTKPNRTTGEVRKGANVTVLTDGGGFIAVYYSADYLGDLPAQGDRVSLAAEVGVWKRPTRNGESSWADLLCSFRQNGPALSAVREAPAMSGA